MRKRSALLVSALAVTFSAQLHAQAGKPAEPAKPPAADKQPPAPAPAGRAAAAEKPAAETATTPAAVPAPVAEPPAAAGPEGDPLPGASEPSADAAPGTPGLAPLPIWPEPTGASTPKPAANEAASGKRPPGTAVFAEDWWSHVRPILEMHGSFRARGELFLKFALGRHDLPSDSIWPRPYDDAYSTTNAIQRGSKVCTANDVGNGSGSSPTEGCDDNTNAGGNLRFRLAPELHISDNLRILSQVDLFDNLVLGSTPSRETSLGVLEDGTEAPSAGRNSLRDSVVMKRAWAEWLTPLGELKFGRMPNHWGLGMMWNAGNGLDDNYQSTIDRAQIITGFKSLELYASASFDFPNEGPTSDTISLERGQPYDIAQLDDVNQYTFSLLRKKDPELVNAALNRGEVVLNGGLQVLYRHQLLSAAEPGCSYASPCDVNKDVAFVRRGAEVWVPNLWFQLLYRGFRFELEGATVQGSIDNVDEAQTLDPIDEYTIAQWGIATEIEQKLAEDKLHLGFKFGWSSGDADVDGLNAGTSFQDQHGDRTLSTFRFNPSYSLDLILYRNLLTSVQGTYYFRPSVAYDFFREPNGQKIGGSLNAVWSRATQFIQSPGHDRDLGVEVDASLYFQSKDGSLNDDLDHAGGFFAKLEYGVLFPMSGLGYASAETAQINQQSNDSDAADTNLAQTLRLFLGVVF